MKWPSYPKTKEPGIEWLGAIPEAWQVLPLFSIMTERCTKNIANKEANVLSLSYGKIIQRDTSDNFGLLPESFETYQIVEPSNIILRLTDLQNDKRSLRVGIVGQGGIITSAYICLELAKADKLAAMYAYYLLHSYDISKIFYSLGGGVRQSIKFEDLKWLQILVPSLSEQRSVASFLDRETARIDQFIAKKERQIELLQEKRSALISHAVTKGLNPKAKMKDSGIEWLGEIPEHWAIENLRRVIDKFVDYRGRTPEKVDSGIPLITAKNIKNGCIDLSCSQEFMNEYEYEGWMVRGWPEKGDVLVTTEAPLGAVAQITDTKIALAQRIILLKVKTHRMTNDYLKYHFLSAFGQGELYSRSTGSTAIGIKADRFKETLIVVPPIDEQNAIAKYIDSAILKQERPLSKIQNSINKLREYRAALISAAVTGKIDVREVTA
jgi:type I restriction enzyme S subunit